LRNWKVLAAAFFADQAAVAATVGLAWPESSTQIIPRGGGGSATRRPPPRRPDAADYRHRLGEAIEVSPHAVLAHVIPISEETAAAEGTPAPTNTARWLEVDPSLAFGFSPGLSVGLTFSGFIVPPRNRRGATGRDRQ
jgi:hypothetical protein